MKISHLRRVYYNNKLSTNNLLKITGDNFHYLKSVIRIKTNSNFRIFNSYDGEYRARVELIDRAYINVVIEEKLRNAEKGQELILALAILKPSSMSDAISSAISMGVTKIIPLITERCQYQDIKKDKLNQIIIEATRQSERLQLATISNPSTLKDFCDSMIGNNDYSLIVASEAESPGNNINKISKRTNVPIIIIGPEGGFSTDELKMLKSEGQAITISLGPWILKSQTAAIAALACINMIRD